MLTQRGGITSMEYALISALIAAVLVSAITSFGSGVTSFYDLAARIAVSG
jgi:Flp pilus assembly pilin Flp